VVLYLSWTENRWLWLVWFDDWWSCFGCILSIDERKVTLHAEKLTYISVVSVSDLVVLQRRLSLHQ
jgi:hypothetical protein